MEDEAVKAEIAKLQLPEGTVVCCDPWIYGTLHAMAIYDPHTNHTQVPMALMMTIECTNASCTCVTRQMLKKQTHVTMRFHYQSHPSSAPRL
jgi:hypothetical protein